jgi:transcriptional regulator with XRE-family HTH domain
MSVQQAGHELDCSPSRVSRIESGEIKPRPGDVMEMLVAYGLPLDDEPAKALLSLTRDLREVGWWQRLDAISGRYATFIAYEAEAATQLHFEPTLIPGLLQTEDYARAVISVGREMESETIEQLVKTRLTRQDVLHRQPKPLVMRTIVSEAALTIEVGSADIVRQQLRHIAELSRLPNVTVQVLRFAAGAHIATHGGFAVLGFEQSDPPLGYIETLAGELFLESPGDVDRLTKVFDHLQTLAMSPSESVKFLQEKADAT